MYFTPTSARRWSAQKILPGTELCDILYTLYEMISYSNWAPHDGLNQEACQWARNHQDLFPLDRRPLKRRALDLHVKQQAGIA